MQKSVGLVLFSTLLAVFCACHQKSDPYYYGPGFLYATGHADVKGDQPQSIAEARSSALVDARAKLEKKVLAFQMDQKRTVRTIIKENPDMAPKLEKMIRKSKVVSERTQEQRLELELEFNLKQLEKITR